MEAQMWIEREDSKEKLLTTNMVLPKGVNEP